MNSYRKRRSNLETTLCVLKAINEGISKPTRIMYFANLSWLPNKKVIENLLAQELISVSTRTTRKRLIRRYTITKKGVKVLEHYEGMKSIMGGVL